MVINFTQFGGKKRLPPSGVFTSEDDGKSSAIVLLDGVVLPVYSGDSVVIRAPFGDPILILRSETLLIDVFVDSIGYRTSPKRRIMQCMTFHCEGMQFIYHDVPIRPLPTIETPEGKTEFEFPATLVHSLRPAATYRFSRDIDIRVRVYERWCEIPYKIDERGGLTFMFPIVITGLRSSKPGNLCCSLHLA